MDKQKFNKVKGGMNKMSISKQKAITTDVVSKSETSFKKESTKPIIATARSGLAGAESALMRRLPSTYVGKTVKDVLSYIVDSKIKDDEAATAASLKNEL